MEVVTMLFQKRKFINCGALIGPYCPIYGVGAVLITLLLNRFKENPILLFFASMIICSFIEYIASYLIERLLNFKWWNYRDNKFNLNGRICLKVSIIFGILGVIFACFANPIICNTINTIPSHLIIIVALSALIVLMVDIFKSRSIMHELKLSNTMSLDTYTEKITEIIKRKKES